MVRLVYETSIYTNLKLCGEDYDGDLVKNIIKDIITNVVMINTIHRPEQRDGIILLLL